ncbi:MAG TPA: PQQ-binding-like beta-propeller repeat protein [Actinomycetota bacterium]
MASGPLPPYRQAWTFRPSEGTVSGPVVQGGTVVTVGTTAVYGVDLATGRQVWKLDRTGGPLAMPAVASVGGRTVLLFTDGTKDAGVGLVAVSLKDRTELWRTALKAPSRSGIAVDGATAFVADDDGNVYAVSVSDGSITWTAKTLGDVLAPPAVAGGRVFVAGRDTVNQRAQLLALDEASGRKDWEFTPSVAGSTGSAASVADGTVVAGAADRSIHAFSAEDGTERWSRLALSLFSPVTAPAVTSDGVYAVDVSGGLYRLDPATGARVWDYQFNQLVVRSAPVVSRGTVLVGLNDGRLVAVDTTSGNLVWQSDPSPGLIGPIALTPNLVVASKGGNDAGLVAYVHDPSATLLDVPSPTRLDAGRLFGNYAIAFVIVLALLLVPIRLASNRIGPPAWEAWEGLDADEEGEAP